MAGGFNVGQLTVRLGADTKGLTALVSAMLQVQRQILESINKMNQSLEKMGGVSVRVANKMATANKTAQENIRSEISKTEQMQQSVTGKRPITRGNVTNVLSEKEAYQKLAKEHEVTVQVIKEAIQQRLAVEKEEEIRRKYRRMYGLE